MEKPKRSYDNELNIELYFKEIESKLLSLIHGNGREIFSFMKWIRNSTKNKITCMYCEKEINKSEVIVLCKDCTE
ncbi:MAG: hypothetical protein HN704_18400 [Bacteroidetes bacterium]|jgi:hypothetical protein|nr:hypothetical protein [Bacteroidota bacterium]